MLSKIEKEKNTFWFNVLNWNKNWHLRASSCSIKLTNPGKFHGQERGGRGVGVIWATTTTTKTIATATKTPLWEGVPPGTQATNMDWHHSVESENLHDSSFRKLVVIQGAIKVASTVDRVFFMILYVGAADSSLETEIRFYPHYICVRESGGLVNLGI